MNRSTGARATVSSALVSIRDERAIIRLIPHRRCALISSMMNRTFLLLLITLPLLMSSSADASDPALALKAFYSDGCTGFVDGPPGRGKLWQHCCFEHDLRYWFGGEETDMDFTDLALKACVKEAAGSGWANVIYDGVRAGHHSPIKSKTHWSWGWTPARAPGPLTKDEVQFVEVELRKLALDPAYIDHFIEKYLERR